MTLILELIKSWWPQIVAIVGAAALGFFAAWQIQGIRLDTLDVEYAGYKLQVERQAVEAREALVRKERQWLEDQNHALVNARTREAQLKKDAAAARTAAGSLRNDIAALRRRLATSPDDACIATAAALGDILNQCSDDYRALAEVADRHASDVQTLSAAWPK